MQCRAVRLYGLLAAFLLLALVAAPAASAAQTGLAPTFLVAPPTWAWYGMVHAVPGGGRVPAPR